MDESFSPPAPPFPSAAWDMDRRALLGTAASTLLLGALSSSSAWAGGRPDVMARWARELVALKDALRGGQISVIEWQRRIDRLNRSVPLSELTAYLDIERVTRGFPYDSDLADAADPLLPAAIVGAAGMRGWFIRAFGLRRGGAIVPHVHNNMVSAHLVIGGGFHARTYDRVGDTPDGVLLRPASDRQVRTGGMVTMSDQRHNAHWLVATADRSMTFDVGIVGLPPSWAYGHVAQSNNMIFVDPTVAPQRNGTIAAPVINWDQARARFAPG
jgi:hypothetical protein